jgi:hypothetical protein
MNHNRDLENIQPPKYEKEDKDEVFDKQFKKDQKKNIDLEKRKADQKIHTDKNYDYDGRNFQQANDFKLRK